MAHQFVEKVRRSRRKFKEKHKRGEMEKLMCKKRTIRNESEIGGRRCLRTKKQCKGNSKIEKARKEEKE